jgi:hypothetical protein
MRKTTCSVFFLAFLVSSISAQTVSPVPVVETEIRDNASPRMRAIELDRLKREAKKTRSDNLGPAGVNNFLEIKEDFEKIQTLEGQIVTIYTTGKQIQYGKIALFSAELNQSALRLKENLFSLQTKDQKTSPAVSEPQESDKALPKDVKGLIVDLDNTIGAFVGNPIFLTSKKTKPKDKEKAAADLERILRLSAALKQEAEKQTPPKN